MATFVVTQPDPAGVVDVKRLVHVMASHVWSTEGGPRPVIVLLHDEYTFSTPEEILEKFVPVLFDALRTDVDFQSVGRFVIVAPAGLAAGLDVTASPWVPPDLLRGGPSTLPEPVVLSPPGPDFAEPEPEAQPVTLALPDAGSFASGHRGLDANSLGADEVTFVEEALFQVFTRFYWGLYGERADLPGEQYGEYALDPRRVFLVGFGNGGELAYRLVRELADAVVAAGRPYANDFRIAGLAVLGSAARGVDPQGTTHAARPPVAGPPPFMVVHGELDDDFPIRDAGTTPSDRMAALSDRTGADPALVPSSNSARKTVLEWLPSPVVETTATISIDGVLLEELRYTDPATGALLARALVDPGLGHAWPDWDLAREIWNFFAAVP